MKRIMTILAFAIVAMLFLSGTAYAAPPFENQCDDGKDNDGDGLLDCDDPDCDGDSACSTCTISEDPEATCDDGIDNDCDGLIDCDDTDCDGTTACSSCTITEDPETSCGDGADNDCDGLVDCDDSDCTADPACGTGVGDYVVIAYNDLGMHCACPRSDIMLLLPPWNTVRAQVIDRVSGSSPIPTNDDTVFTLEYNIRENTYGDGSEYDLANDAQYLDWLDSAEAHFPGCGISRTNPVGLAGKGLNGVMDPHDLVVGKATTKLWIAEGIPAFPDINANDYDFIDVFGDPRKAYLAGDLVLKDAATGDVLATTTTTVPVAFGGCCNCHIQVAIDNGYVKSGATDPDPYDSFQCMMEMHYRDTGVDVLNELAVPTYDADGHLTNTDVPIRCSKCHTDLAVGGDAALDPAWVDYGLTSGGVTEISTFSKVLHGFHGSDPEVATMDPNIDNNCYQCHPGDPAGGKLDCYRGHHSDKVNNGVNLWCSDCHGDLDTRLSSGQLDNPWHYTTLPDCGDCHNGGGYSGPGEPNIFGKYLGSGGHKNDLILCSTCHGEPHALAPSSLALDNGQNLDLQNDERAIGVCDVCHVGKSTDWSVPAHN